MVKLMGDPAEEMAMITPEQKALLIADKDGVTVTSDPGAEEGTISLTINEHEKVVHLYVKNTGAKSVCLTSYHTVDLDCCSALSDDHGINQGKKFKLGKEECKIRLRFLSSQAGIYRGILVFKFDQAQPIVRLLEVTYCTTLDKELAPNGSYKRHYNAPKDSRKKTVRRPPRRYDNQQGRHPKTVVRLPRHVIPNNTEQLRKFLSGSKVPTSPEIDESVAVLKRDLSWEQYAKRFKLLLYLEELQMKKEIKKYNMVDASMVRDYSGKNLLILQVPGVSENRPSVLPGDKVFVTPSEQSGYLANYKYEGSICHVDRDQVYLHFNRELLECFTEAMKFSVEFTVNTLTMSIQHRALDLVKKPNLKNVLFPSGATSSNNQLQRIPKDSLFNKDLEENPEQLRAVQHIVAGSSKPAPYLVFGPPGTGKTVTVVEAIKQIHKSQKNCHILVCAPTNSAVDLLCERIIYGMKKTNVFRFYARTHPVKNIPQKLQSCCNLEEGELVIPFKEKLMTYKIMVTTLQTASRLVTLGIPPGYYTHIFVDEAGCAKETECIIPLAGLLNPKTGQVVLVGDPKQLGPIVYSSIAQEYGMGVSLLDRLMKIYKKCGKYNDHFVTKLLRNYRSHPAILKTPNDLFYDGELEACADRDKRNSYSSWEELPKPGFPVVFHGVVGLDEREANSPSYFNRAEVNVLMDYLKKLAHSLRQRHVTKIEPKHIGIITPYRKQVEKVRQAIKIVEKDLKIGGLENIKVGSVEEFQGDEAKVILVSTVRSNAKHIVEDKKFNLGFVHNEKRFNVAITRAQALLIVVGNPRILMKDDSWEKFIKYCSAHGGYRGSSVQQGEALQRELLMLTSDKRATDKSLPEE